MKQTLMDMLTAAVNTFRISDVDYYQKFLDFCAKNNMHRFSAENQLLIFRQKPDAELCIPYSFWKKQGRVPGKGTGIRIFPEKFYHEDVPYVFDIRDTFGRELTDSSLVWIVSEQTRQELQKSFAAEDFKAAVDVLVHKYLSEHMLSGNMKKEELVFAEEAASWLSLPAKGPWTRKIPVSGPTLQKGRNFSEPSACPILHSGKVQIPMPLRILFSCGKKKPSFQRNRNGFAYPKTKTGFY